MPKPNNGRSCASLNLSDSLRSPSRKPVRVGYLVQSFDAVRKLANSAPPAAIVLPLQQTLREANAVCLDYARFALAYVLDARSFKGAETDLNQLSFSRVWLPNMNQVPGILVGANLRGVSKRECMALDMWLTFGLTPSMYMEERAEEAYPLPFVEQTRRLLEVVIRSGELTVPAGCVEFITRSIFQEEYHGPTDPVADPSAQVSLATEGHAPTPAGDAEDGAPHEQAG